MFDLSYLLRKHALMFGVIIGVSGLPVTAQVGLGLTPMRQEFQMAPGTQQTGVLSLANDSTAKTRVAVEIQDFYIDATGTPQFVKQAPREAQFSCRQWLSVNPMDLEVESKQQAPVRFTLRAPASVTEGSYHCSVGFTSRPTVEQATRTGLRTAVQVVAAFYVVVGKPAVQGTVKDLRLEYVPDPNKPGWRAVVVFGNPSRMHFRPSGALDVLDQSGEVVETAQFLSLPVLPQRDQNFLFPLQLKSGKYTLRERVDLGMNEIQEATAVVVASQPAQ